jgi:two-component sensor histidine kinase
MDRARRSRSATSEPQGVWVQAIENLLAREIDGKAIVAFAPEGLRCSIEAPFTEKLGARA